MLDTLFFILWVIATFAIFIYLKNRTSVISFNGMTGFIDAYLGLLIESGIAAAVVVGVPLWILQKVGLYIIGAVVIIAVIAMVVKKGGNNDKKTTSMSKVINEDNKSNRKQIVDEARFCANCGEKINRDDLFCGNCGEKVK